MAIKGKKKKSGGKSRTAPPRRATGKGDQRFLSRRWVQLTGVGVAAFLVGSALTSVVFGGSGDTEPTAEGSRHVTALRSAVDPILFPLGSASVPEPGGVSHFNLFPGLTGEVARIKSGAFSYATIKEAGYVAGQASAAANTFGALRLSDFAGGLPTRTEDALYSSEHDMIEGLQLYEQAAGMIIASDSATGNARRALIAHAVNIASMAVLLFDHGYIAYSDVLGSAGLSSLTVGNPQQPPPAPPGGGQSP